MNGQYAQIKTVFQLGSSNQYSSFFGDDNDVGDWVYAMERDWGPGTWWGGVYEEFSPGDSSFWDWKVLHEAEGKGVFWFIDSFGEVYAIALPGDKAELIYGLQLISKNDNIQSTWE